MLAGYCNGSLFILARFISEPDWAADPDRFIAEPDWFVDVSDRALRQDPP